MGWSFPRNFSLSIATLRVFIAAAAVALCIGAQWLPAPGNAPFADEWLRDHFARLYASDEAEQRVTVVDIDEASLAAIGAWPWPRARLAALLESLLSDYGARGVALDMGYPTKLVKQRLNKADVLILEFNHDPVMLKQSDRPWELKQRILSKTGHMSNEAALELLSEVMHERLRTVVLAHLSRECNCPRHARGLVEQHLKSIGRGDIKIVVGDQDEVGSPIRV